MVRIHHDSPIFKTVPFFFMPITAHDLFLVGFLVFLEGILSIDNALVLALLAKRLPPEQQKKALTYGLAGAFLFRFIALFFVTWLIKWNWVKYVGGAYLIFISLKYFLGAKKEEDSPKATKLGFVKAILLIELTDIAFAVDSILAAVALAQKFWIVFTGGVLGVIAMRFAASIFIQLLNRFPRLETTAYLLILNIGIKLIIEALRIPGVQFHSPHSISFWGFWAVMLACLVYGLIGKKPKHNT